MHRFLMALFISLAICICSCGSSKPEQVKITLTMNYEDGLNCQTYLADYYEIFLYDSLHRKVDEKHVDCGDGINEFTISEEKEKYYFTVALKDDNGSIKSYGSGIADASESDVTIAVNMAEFKGGAIFTWNSSDCDKYNVSLFKFTMINDENEKVSTIIWGEETEISEYVVNCEAESFQVINIDSGIYTVQANAFRVEDSENPRIVYNIPEFKTVQGQISEVAISDSEEIVVSDLLLSWEFDSKSIKTCSDAGITTVIASLISDDKTFAITQECDNKFNPFTFYDIPENTYEILLRGMDDSENTLFESSKELEIKKGSIGQNALSESIYLKEK